MRNSRDETRPVANGMAPSDSGPVIEFIEIIASRESSSIQKSQWHERRQSHLADVWSVHAHLSIQRGEARLGYSAVFSGYGNVRFAVSPSSRPRTKIPMKSENEGLVA